MVTFYKWLGMFGVIIAAWLFVPVMFSMKSDIAVVIAVLVMAAVPGVLYAYYVSFIKKPTTEKV